jgi:hypothetical protein
VTRAVSRYRWQRTASAVVKPMMEAVAAVAAANTSILVRAVQALPAVAVATLRAAAPPTIILRLAPQGANAAAGRNSIVVLTACGRIRSALWHFPAVRLATAAPRGFRRA